MNRGREWIDSWLGAVERGDVDTLVDMSRPDVELSNPLGPLHGHDGIRQYFNLVTGSFSDRSYPISNLVEVGDTLVAEFRDQSRNTGPIPSPQGVIPATGKTVNLPVCAIYELKDGKLARSRVYFDMLTFLQQIGIMPHSEHS